jgi:murein DD-endopeptidase MepM/ murein hydrolase activator NlpD
VTTRKTPAFLARFRVAPRVLLGVVIAILMLARLGPVAAERAARVEPLPDPGETFTVLWPEEPVPSPELAESLGIGRLRSALDLMYAPPDPAILAAIDAPAPERLLWPVDGASFGRGFGYTRETRPELIHNGVDMAAPTGTIVRAAADGLVAYANDGVRNMGNFIVIVHANGWVTAYAHNSEIMVQPGDRVHRGDRIALVGMTGLAHGPHVHFEMYVHGHAVDPTPLFDGGPQHVQRIAEYAASRGLVPPPQPLTEADRAVPATLEGDSAVASDTVALATTE